MGPFDVTDEKAYDTIKCTDPGQIIILPAAQQQGYSYVGVLATGVAMINNAADGVFKVTYTDDTTMESELFTVNDWCKADAERAVVSYKYRHLTEFDTLKGRNNDPNSCYIFEYRFAVDAGKKIKSVQLMSLPKVRVFAISLALPK